MDLLGHRFGLPMGAFLTDTTLEICKKSRQDVQGMNAPNANRSILHRAPRATCCADIGIKLRRSGDHRLMSGALIF